MAAAQVGGALLSGFISVMLERLAPGDVIMKFFRGKKDLVKLLDELRIKLMSADVLLSDAEEKQLTRSDVKKWLDELTRVIYKADFLMDKIDNKALLRKIKYESATTTSKIRNYASTLTRKFEKSVIDEGNQILKSLNLLLDQKVHLGLIEGVPNRSLQRLDAPFVVKESDVVGRDGDKEAIINLLLSDDTSDKNLSVIPIVGMGGIGKTTLAQLVYKDSRVQQHFNLKVWVTVSEEFDVFQITKGIYEQVTSEECKIIELFVLQSILNEVLAGKRFLFVLNDIRNQNYRRWESLKGGFQSGAYGSSVIVTTRSKDVALTMSKGVMHELELVSDEDCWWVFEKLAFDDNQEPTEELRDIGLEIVKRCKGLPLAVKSVAALLRTTSNPEEWRKILNSDIWLLQLQENLKNNIEGVPTRSLQRLDAPLVVKESDVVGRDGDKEEIIRLLLSDDTRDKNLFVIPIVGLAGLGKTTLAQLVYKDRRVQSGFGLKVWVTVSEEFDVFQITKGIYEQVTYKECKIKELFVLQSILNEVLAGKRFLFVLDDIRNQNYQRWESLKGGFQSGAYGSRVIMTMRSKDVALTMSKGVMHELELVSDEDCWRVFEKHVFDDNQEPTEELRNIGLEIVKRCKGLPLAVKSVAALLRSTSNPEEWRKILNSDIWQLQLQENLKNNIESVPNRSLQRSDAPLVVKESDVVGRDGDKEAIIRLLLSDDTRDKNLFVIPIVGLAGLGKTTLAQLVYKDRRVQSGFGLKVWVTVSEEFDVFQITKRIFEQVTYKECKIKELFVLQSILNEVLAGKRFLFVLDDIRNQNYQRWESLKGGFQSGAYGSSVIVTTRSKDVALTMNKGVMHELELVSDEDCWQVFVKHVFDDNEEPIEELQNIGLEIVRGCKGLPLAVKSVAALLRFTSNPEDWRKILNSDIWQLQLQENLKNNIEGVPNRSLQRSDAPLVVKESDVVGRDGDKEAIIRLLLSDDTRDKNLFVIPIVGLAGLGKTTLAQLVYKDWRVQRSFGLKVWVTVSEEFDVFQITKGIYEQVTSKECKIKELYVLQSILNEVLDEKRFLFVLDDVRNQNYQRWEALKGGFQSGAFGSSVIVTTRSKDVALTMNKGVMHELELVSDEDCWRVFVKHVFDDNEEPIEELQNIGLQIVRGCKGLPLAVKSVAALLRFTSNPEEWRKILNSDIWQLQLQENLKNNIEGVANRSLQRLDAPLVVKESDVVGRDGDKEAIIRLLLSDDTRDKNLSVIPIVGLAGLGKTTLAQLVYKDWRVQRSFGLKVWVTVSEEFDVFQITKGIFEQVTYKECKIKELFVLQSILNEILAGKRFLFVLDDVWNVNYERWESLTSGFHLGACGSRIIVTTCSKDVALTMSKGVMHELGLVSDEDCCRVFEKNMFDSIQEPTEELENIGLEIVRGCKGLPLAVKSVAALLRSTSNPKEWGKILNSDIWQLQFEENLKNNIAPALWLSYHFLPPILKRCLAYCSIFPKDYEFGESDMKKIILLWMAEGFLTPENGSRTEDVGKAYLQGLISRSFFQPSSTNKSAMVMHDLVHHLAMFISSELCFSCGDSNDLSNLGTKSYHLSYRKRSDDLMKLGAVFQSREKILPSLRTLLALPLSYLCVPEKPISLHELFLRVGGCVRVLSLSESSITELPNSIGNMKYLRYLDLSETSIKELPDSICTFYYLQTLLLSMCVKLAQLPTRLAALVNLRHLDIRGTSLKQMPPQMGKMRSLETLSDFVLGENDGKRIKELGELPLLGGSLRISGLDYIFDVRDVLEANLKDKEFLSELILEWHGVFNIHEREILEALQPHTSLKLLRIRGYRGTIFPDWVGHESFCDMDIVELWDCRNVCMLPPLGQLSSLRKLEIRNLNGVVSVGNEFCGSSSTTTNQPFTSLQQLYLCGMTSWVEWSFSSDRLDQEGGVFPSLKNFEISGCRKLTVGLFDCHLPSLESIRISDCDEMVGAFVCPSFQEMDTNAFPSLQSMFVGNCPRLESLLGRHSFLSNLKHLTISMCKRLWKNRMKWGLERLTSLMTLSLDLRGIEEEVDSFPEKGLLPTTLTELSIENFEKLKGLNGREFQHLTSLQNLKIWYCRELECLPQEGLPLSLFCLSIRGCPLLKQRCQRRTAQDWPIIQHIPKIEIR